MRCPRARQWSVIVACRPIVCALVRGQAGRGCPQGRRPVRSRRELASTLSASSVERRVPIAGRDSGPAPIIESERSNVAGVGARSAGIIVRRQVIIGVGGSREPKGRAESSIRQDRTRQGEAEMLDRSRKEQARQHSDHHERPTAGRARARAATRQETRPTVRAPIGRHGAHQITRQP